MQWRFELRGKQEILVCLPDLFSSSDPWIERLDDRFYLCSASFDIPPTALESDELFALNRAELSLHVVNVVASIYVRDFHPPWIAAEWFLSPAGWTQKSAMVPAILRVDKQRENPHLRPGPDATLAAVIRLSNSDRQVNHIFRVIKTAEWGEPEDLYKILDAIRTDVGSGGAKQLEIEGIVRQEEFKRCTGSLNMRRKVLPKDWKRPRNPMSLEDAEDFTRQTVAAWVKWRSENLE